MCPDLFSEEAPCGSILVCETTTQSSHFGCSLWGWGCLTVFPISTELS